MVVQHNLTAMNSNRMLGITTGQQAKSSEKLASGYQINRAADDAAGLSISEKMRKQMRGLDRASTNAQDGISAVQTAEGALTEVHAMLQRINELAVQAANGTNSEDDRAAIQAEVEQLTTEIDRVAESTKFNESYLLKGDEGTMDMHVKAHDAGIAGKLSTTLTTATFTTDVKAGDKITIGGREYEIGISEAQAEAMVKAGATVSIDGRDFKITADGKATDLADKPLYVETKVPSDTAATFKVTSALTTDASTVKKLDGTTDLTNAEVVLANVQEYIAPGSKVSDGTTEYTVVSPADDSVIELSKAYELIKAELEIANSIGTDEEVTVTNVQDGSFTWTLGTAEVAKTLSFNLHVGADADMTNKIGVDIEAMSAAGLGIKGLNVADDNGMSATYAIDAIADAVAKVSAQRSALGAIQNRLEHTIANLDNVVENTTAAESRIRDTDMASEMVEYSKNNILAQAGQSMLAQANQATQGVLSLLG